MPSPEQTAGYIIGTGRQIHELRNGGWTDRTPVTARCHRRRRLLKAAIISGMMDLSAPALRTRPCRWPAKRSRRKKKNVMGMAERPDRGPQQQGHLGASLTEGLLVPHLFMTGHFFTPFIFIPWHVPGHSLRRNYNGGFRGKRNGASHKKIVY